MSETITGELAENLTEAAPTTEVVADAAPQETTTEEASKSTQPAWAKRRIDQLTRAAREAERRAALAEQALMARAAPEGEAAPIVAPTREQFQSAVEEATAKARFDDQCNNIYHAGVEKFPDFTARIAQFSQIGGLNPVLVEAAQEAGNPEEVLYALAGDLDEAARIAELPPVRQAAAVARFALTKKAESKRVTNAPAPIKPITPAAKPTEDPEKMSPAEWREWREKQLAAKRARR